MRLIDADALFDAAFKVWGNESDGGETNLFMEMINNAPTITPPSNDPLTLLELREMDGEPVWVVVHSGGRYAVIRCVGMHFAEFTDGARPPVKDYGKTWAAYRRKQEERTK